MLEFRNVGIEQSGNKLLRNVNFSAKKGRITVLLGKNGSGKSTLLRCIFGLCRYSGDIMLSGEEVSSLKSSARAKAASFLPQLLPETAISVYSLASLGRNPHIGSMGALSDIDIKAVENALACAKMTEFSGRSVNTLSGGERQRAFLAMVLAQDTPFIVLDEPSSFLDPSARRELYSLLRELVMAKGKTILTVMHDLADASDFADDIAIMDRGTVAAYGKSEDVINEGIIERIFAVRRFEALCDGDKRKRIFFS